MAPSAGGSRLGRLGEDAAGAWYLAQGYDVVRRNWSCRSGEIDLICRRGRVLVICEVKTRSGDGFGSPFEAVTSAKRRRLRRLATLYLLEAAPDTTMVRFDVAAVTDGRVEVLENAF
ncbi:MAG: YraN family protein [Acidimicrobiales bacterium]|jgi:putative endonuclease